MKITRKMKKAFVSIFTATLSFIMLITQVGAANIVSYREYFEYEGVVDAVESMGWHIPRNIFSFGVDLTCYESEDVDCVRATLELTLRYPASSTGELLEDSDSGFFTPENTEDSDELNLSISNFSRGYETIEIEAFITYEIRYDNGVFERYVYEYDGAAYDGQIYYFRTEVDHDFIIPVGE